ncbi:3-hydroxyacyl-CoA dehydrogenase family protein [Novosphingobium sediminicola]|uniref:3-hydroxybutyryl-CoA dehydrogenase n=1 Tax=Novosphingobium sediminicola TaxID=563162 RepID=A0A7W6G8F3_9SPHN|nr:3-hydroxyacyl-CoA dehydrogenase NAD-binding domain-containing protein [Novosphingobium sediminicola]MBB3957251.1 3-hydroxybutyryl-CoA dehydrogenase [Novosphingobium sediminicola]
MKIVGVIGAGQMGVGIAQTAAQTGHSVRLSDISLELAEKGKAGIGKSLARLVAKEKLSEDQAQAILAAITPVGELAAMAEADIIIEAATEREEVKLKIFESTASILAPSAILATNTSSLSITRMSRSAPDQSRFIGMHFFNPVPVMPLVEVIPGLATSDDITIRTKAFGEKLGKTVVLAQDDPGFVVNRIFVPFINEAIFVLGNSTGSIVDIDAGVKLGLAHPMGPLELADFIGLDTLYEIMMVYLRTTGDSKYRPAPLLQKYVEAGWFGRKNGRGFYDYSGGKPVPTR